MAVGGEEEAEDSKVEDYSHLHPQQVDATISSKGSAVALDEAMGIIVVSQSKKSIHPVSNGTETITNKDHLFTLTMTNRNAKEASRDPMHIYSALNVMASPYHESCIPQMKLRSLPVTTPNRVNPVK